LHAQRNVTEPHRQRSAIAAAAFASANPFAVHLVVQVVVRALAPSGQSAHHVHVYEHFCTCCSCCYSPTGRLARDKKKPAVTPAYVE
jgi:hypothetical protein